MEQVEEVGELRIAFEPEASRLAASYATESTLAGIGEALDTMKASVSDPDAFIAADLRFHRAIVQASHNPLLLRIDSLLSAVYASVRVVHTWSVSRNEQTLPGHVRVLEAIRARDGDIAAAEMRSLVETALCDVRTICSFGEPTQEMV